MAADLLLIAVLVVANAGFAGTEIAVVSLRRSQLLRLAGQHGRRGRTLLAATEQPTRFLSTIQVGITLAGFFAAATAAVSLAEPVEPLLGFLGGAARGGAVVLVTLSLTFVMLVFGELVPKRIAMRRPERWALAAALPVAFVARALRPLVWLLTRSTDLVASLLGGGRPDDGEEPLTDEEVLDVIATEADITPARRALVEGVLELRERTVREVLVPRRDVFVLDAGLTVAEGALALARAGRSRAPVGTDGELDEVHGVVVLGRLVAAEAQEATLLGSCDEPLVVPEVALVQDVLALLQQRRRQLALVADEHGSYVGIVTMEDLLEEIVGELYDELDRDLAPDDPRGYQRRDDGSYELPGSFPVHDLPDLGLPVPPDTTAATVAGIVLDGLGELPVDGQELEAGALRIVVLEMDGTVIVRVAVRLR